MAGETSLPNTNPPPPSEMSNVQFEDYFPLPPELSRTPTGSTVVEPDSVMDDSGRTFAGYKQGKYLLPNDAVSCFRSWKDDSEPPMAAC